MFPDLHASLQMHEQQRTQHCGLASMPKAVEEWHQGHARDSGLRGSVLAYLHIRRLWGTGALPAYRAGYRSFLLLVLGQTGDICHPAGVLISSAGGPHVAKQCIVHLQSKLPGQQDSGTATLAVKDGVKDPWQGF